VAAAFDVGQQRREQPAGAAFRCGEGEVAVMREIEDGGGEVEHVLGECGVEGFGHVGGSA
jgi:hypothetical protein